MAGAPQDGNRTSVPCPWPWVKGDREECVAVVDEPEKRDPIAVQTEGIIGRDLDLCGCQRIRRARNSDGSSMRQALVSIAKF